ncbi:MAG: type II secretion system F family protein [Gallionella sp.]|nr:type II secretion system F family protein [Gallionella sp.]
MPLYSYRAIDERGKPRKGWQEAANLVDLEQRLKRGGLDLIDGRADAGTRAVARRRVKRPELITFFFNLAQLGRAGVPLLESLADLRDSLDDVRFREAVADLVESIEGGKKMSQAMLQHPEVFDRIFVSLVRAGEESGRLTEVFEHITESLKWQDEMAAHTRNIMVYPIFVGITVLAITFFLMIYLVPQLLGFIREMGQDIPFQTRMLLAVSSVFVDYWYLIILSPLALVFAARLLISSSPEMQFRFDDIKLKMWVTGPVLRKITLARFANTFAMMYSSGVSVLDCIANLRELVNNRVLSKSLEDISLEIAAGRNLTQSFQRSGMFPPLVIRMIKIGESTGELDAALLNVGYFYDRDVKESIKRMQIMVEPVMTLLLGLLLGWVMLSVLGPIYDIIGKVRF